MRAKWIAEAQKGLSQGSFVHGEGKCVTQLINLY